MQTDLSRIISRKTTEELVEIAVTNREDYQLEAIEIAERELKSRQITSETVEEVEKELLMKGQFDSMRASTGMRVIHFIVDSTISILVAIIPVGIFELLIPELDAFLGFLLMSISWFGYFVLMEYNFQKTVGKFLARTKVVTKDGKKPELNEVLLRTAFRLLPFDRVSYILSKDGFHDRLSNTMVVKDETNVNEV